MSSFGVEIPSVARPRLSRSDACDILLEAKTVKGISFDELSKKLGKSEVWLAAAFYGQHTIHKDDTLILLNELGIDVIYKEEIVRLLERPPLRGYPNQEQLYNDPTISRFLEIVKIYGLPLKSIINEKFGDGIMSAIDFKAQVDKVEDPTTGANRVVITLNGKFLPYSLN